MLDATAEISETTVWKAIVTSVSSVDASGIFEIGYEVYTDDVLAYPNLSARGASVDEIEKVILVRMSELKAVNEYAIQIKIGQEFFL